VSGVLEQIASLPHVNSSTRTNVSVWATRPKEVSDEAVSRGASNRRGRLVRLRRRRSRQPAGRPDGEAVRSTEKTGGCDQHEGEGAGSHDQRPEEPGRRAGDHDRHAQGSVVSAADG